MSEVLSTPVTAPRRLTFTFAKRHGVLVRRVTNGVVECVYKPAATPLAIAEARRYLRMPMRLEKITDGEFDALLRSTYESGSGAIEAASGLMNLTMLPMWILSGVFFSSQRFPDAVQPIIAALPLTALNDALRATMLQGATLAQIAPEAGVLAAWLLVSFPIALKLFRWR